MAALVATVLAVRPAAAQLSGASRLDHRLELQRRATLTASAGSRARPTSTPARRSRAATRGTSTPTWASASTRDSSGSAQHNLSFSAQRGGRLPTRHRHDVRRRHEPRLRCLRLRRGGERERRQRLVEHRALSGGLSIGDPGSIGNGGGDSSIPFNGNSSATIFRVSNSVPQNHTLTFTWNGSVRSNSCEAAVRIGQQNGTTSGCDACGYPGTPSRTQSSDGHVVTVNFTSLCGNGSIDASAGEQCDQGGANGSSTSCCTSQCQFRSAGQTCRVGGGAPCDVSETCTGSSGSCPADDAPGKAGVTCNAGSGDVCDPVRDLHRHPRPGLSGRHRSGRPRSCAARARATSATRRRRARAFRISRARANSFASSSSSSATSARATSATPTRPVRASPAHPVLPDDAAAARRRRLPRRLGRYLRPERDLHRHPGPAVSGGRRAGQARCRVPGVVGQRRLL